MDRMTPPAWGNVKKSFRALKWYEWIMAAIMILIAAYAMVEAFTAPSAEGNPPWLMVVNFISAVAGIFCVFFCAKASVSNFFFGLINTAAYIVYLAYWRIWGTMCLELFLYLPMGVIGWINWAKHRDEKRTERTQEHKCCKYTVRTVCKTNQSEHRKQTDLPDLNEGQFIFLTLKRDI